MADPLTLLFVPLPNRRVSIGAITLDATIREFHKSRYTVTDHPIESGGFVTDHVYEEPFHLLIEGEISNSPVVIFSSLPGISDRRIEAFDQLNLLAKNKDVVSVVTGLKIYDNLVITTLFFPRDQKTGGRLQFSAEFQQANFVNSEIVGVVADKAAPVARDQVQPEQDLGRQATTKPEPTSLIAKRSSQLYNLLGKK